MRAAVGVGDEHDRPVDGADEVAHGSRAARDAAQRIGGGDHTVAVGHERIDHPLPARRLGECAVDENDRA
jgi:hypothetical protein